MFAPFETLNLVLFQVCCFKMDNLSIHLPTRGSLLACIIIILLSGHIFAQTQEDYTSAGDLMARANKHFWLPTGDLNRGGFHFGTTIQLGAESYKVGALYWGADIRFTSKNKDPYKYIHEGVEKSSQRYRSNNHMFLIFEHHTVKMKRWVLYPALSVGFSGLSFEEGRDLLSFAVGGGVGVKYFFARGIPAYILFKHNFLNYKNPGGSSLAGNAISINSGFSLPIAVH